jgi:hypothetical protein
VTQLRNHRTEGDWRQIIEGGTGPRTPPRSLIIHEEECAIVAIVEFWDVHRTAESETELVLPEWGFGPAGSV